MHGVYQGFKDEKVFNHFSYARSNEFTNVVFAIECFLHLIRGAFIIVDKALIDP